MNRKAIDYLLAHNVARFELKVRNHAVLHNHLLYGLGRFSDLDTIWFPVAQELGPK